MRGWGALSDEDIAEACLLARQALEAERDDAETIRQAAWTLFSLAGEAAIEAIERARRLSPFDRHASGYDVNIAVAHLVARRFEQAIEWVDRALHEQPRTVVGMRAKVVALAHLGRLDEARAELSRLLAVYPKLTIAGYREQAFMAPEVLELYVDGLRLAGLPER